MTALFFPTCAWILVSGLDDLFITGVWLFHQFTRQTRSIAPAPTCRPPRSIAIFVPLWREHRVIGHMVETNLRAIEYFDYQFFIGVYPNDEPTLEVVRELESRFPNVHLALTPQPGPTSKADCLNAIYECMVRHEREYNSRFEVIVTHDAEDVIHPEALDLISRYSWEFDMVQVPVLPLPTPARQVTHGVYCDEFAEYQSKDIPVRQLLGGFLPSNGVGTGFTRTALERLAAERGRIFDPASLTEDYENGLRLHQLGCRQIFVPLCLKHGQPVATREYFPGRLSTAVRQRTRWITGICLQGWEHHGWRGGWSQVYWFWRDRKGLLGNLVSVVANLLYLYGLLTLAGNRMAGLPWMLGPKLAVWPLAYSMALTLGLQLVAISSRAWCVSRIYGWRFAALSPLRTIWANAINSTATVLACRDYFRAWRAGRDPSWRKTDHDYPLRQFAVPGGWIEPGEVDLQAARALPAHVSRRWRVLPFRVVSGNLFVASAEPPTDQLMEELSQFTRLEIRLRLVTQENYDELAGRLL